MCLTTNLPFRTGARFLGFSFLFVPQSHRRINARRALRRNHARHHGHKDQCHRCVAVRASLHHRFNLQIPDHFLQLGVCCVSLRFGLLDFFPQRFKLRLLVIQLPRVPLQ